jgi:hypothetical protein
MVSKHLPLRSTPRPTIRPLCVKLGGLCVKKLVKRKEAPGKYNANCAEKNHSNEPF